MTPQQWQTVRALVAWLDAENGSGLHEGAMRLLKIGEEVGEYADAVEACIQAQFASNHVADWSKAAAELVDVQLTAMVALATVATNPQDAYEAHAIPVPDSPRDSVIALTRAGRPVAQAWIGWQGQNPRKGITHRLDDLADALCRLIGTAEAALSQYSVDIGDPAAFFDAKLRAVAARVLPNLEAEVA